MSEQKEKFADEILDKALANYSHAEPRLGLEGRVLARLDEEKQSPARVWKWAWAPAAAALLIAGGLYLARPRTQAPPAVAEQPAPPRTAATKPELPPIQAAQARPRSARRAAPAPQVTAAAKLSQFPAPQPLSEQDRLLLAYVRSQPQAAAQQARTSGQPMAEIKIDPLEIPPLEPDGNQPAPER